MPMAWTNKYRRFVAVFGRLVMVVARVRLFVGIGIGLIAVFSFTVLTENDRVGKFFYGDQRQKGLIASELTFISDSKSLGCFARDTVYFVPCNGKRIRVEIKVARFANASTRRKMLLLLPGWNFADTQWCTRTRVCDEASKRGYDVMLVEMGKSVYMDSLYPQMRADYRLHPTRTWLWDSVLKPLQKRSYFTDLGIPEDPIKTVDGEVYYRSMQLPIPSYVMGLSTGARGAFLLALEHPEAFVGCAGLSGDYNPLLMKNDNLMINCLGKYDDIPWRWRGTNNIEMRADFFKVPMYLAHGSDDRVVPMKQTESLLLAIERSEACKARAAFPKVYTAVTHHYLKEKIVQSEIVVGAGHDYIFWNQAGLKALDYFDELLLMD
jgi:pimeloyl-ACP methyl ester carboxylesterase